MGHWDVINVDPDGNKLWRCPKCGETYAGRRYQGQSEFTTDEIKQGRKKYRKELLQPFRQGEVSKEYLDAYPDKKEGMIKEGIITQQQADKAKEVWFNDNV
jgi:uncharacterized C2H2 Zn-finger protein